MRSFIHIQMKLKRTWFLIQMLIYNIREKKFKWFLGEQLNSRRERKKIVEKSIRSLRL